VRAAPGTPMTLPTSSSGRPILARADLEVYDPRFVRAGGRERFFCPIHGGDHQRSLSVDPATGHYTCHACKAKGTLRDHWTDGSSRPATRRAPSLEEIGRQILAMRERTEAARAERLAGDLPLDASAFLSKLGTFGEALRDPDCPGAAYLRGRGLDPTLAAQLGAGYAPANTWPGDRWRAVGRIVYPLANPTTGQTVSALGRLCVDEDPTWSDGVRSAFRAAKQRKLAGCPAGVWPYASVAAARDRQRPLVAVEGPADALALLQKAPDDLAVLALLGTANVLPTALVRALPGIVMALDEDGPGAKAMRALRTEFAIAGARVELLPDDWLGGLKDAGALAATLVAGADDDVAASTARRYDDAVDAVQRACQCLVSAAWDDDAVARLLTDFHARCATVYDQLPEDRRQVLISIINELDAAIDHACAARNWQALVQATKACEQTYEGALHS